MAEVIEIGTLYFDGRPQEVGVEYNNERLSIGPTVPGKAIQWVKANDLLVADRAICTNVNWEQLNACGFVFGVPVQIDGKWYLCRCLKVGAKGGDPNEWDAALYETGEDDGIWHWKGQYFWGQETPEGWASTRAVRGCYSARDRSISPASNRYATVGFRPALEALVPVPLDYGPLVGTEITPMGPDNKFVSGRLASFTDYDLVLEAPSPLPDACKWAVPDGKQIIVERASVSWLREV